MLIDLLIICEYVYIFLQRGAAWREAKGLHHCYYRWETQSDRPLQRTGQTGSVSIHDSRISQPETLLGGKKQEVWKLISEQAQTCLYGVCVCVGGGVIGERKTYYISTELFSGRVKEICGISGHKYKTWLNSQADIYKRINNHNDFCPCLRSWRCKWEGKFWDVRQSVETLALV